RAQWYAGLLGYLGDELDPTGKLTHTLEEFWGTHHQQRGLLQRWFAALYEIVLPHIPGPVVLCVDEVDYVRSLPFATDDFFAAIRACYNQQRTGDPSCWRLTFCLLGVATPAELIQDPNTTSFNIGQRIELTDFTPTEAAPLATGLGGTPVRG